MSSELTDKSYLGDGVYCGFDGYQIWIWTFDGIKEKNFIAIEPHVLDLLNNYFDVLKKKYEAGAIHP